MTQIPRILSFLFGILCFASVQAHARSETVYDARQLTTRNDTINLRGPWEFYWQRFVNPLDMTTVPDDLLPGGTGWKKTDPYRPGTGFASYRLRINGFEFRKDGYEISIPFIMSAYRLTMFPEQDPTRITRFELGQVGESESATVPMTLGQAVSFHPLGPHEVWVITIHIANFDHSNGGLRTVPEIAPGSQLSHRWRRQMDSAFFCAGILFIMFLYNLMLFVRRPEDKASLIAALAILSIALRSVATSNMIFYLAERAGKDILYINHIFEYITLTGSGILFSLFLQLTFLPAAYPRLLKRVSLLFSPLLMATLVLPVNLFTRLLPLYQLSTAFFIGLGFWVVMRALVMRLDGSLTVFLGGMFILLSFVYDLLVNYGILPHPFILQYATALYIFLGSETLARQFAKAFRTAEKLQGNLKKEVYKQTAEIKQIMASIPQGIFTMGRDLCIEGQYSQHLEFILQSEALEGREALPLLFAHSNVDTEQLSMLRSALLASMGEELLVWDFNQHCLIHEFQVHNPKLGLRIFELDWNPIANAAARIEQILVALRDVTDWRKLQETNQQREEELNLLLELVPIPHGRWQNFIKQSHQLLAKAEDPGTSSRRSSAIALHTLKGLARSMGCRHLSVAVHEAEELLSSSPQASSSPPPAFMKSLRSLRQLLTRYEALWSEKLKRNHEDGERPYNQEALLEELVYQRQQLARTAQEPHLVHRLVQTLDNYIQSTLYIPLFGLLREVTEVMAPLATELGRIPPEVRLEGTDQWIHRQTANVLRMSLVHLIRNALDHGIEPPDERSARGKNPKGVICWQVTADADKVRISCRDDGRGLDLEGLLKKASMLGLSREELQAMPYGITDVIFISGLSSKDAASEVSGRGIGMDALRSMIVEIGGGVWARMFHPDGSQGQFHAFEIVIELPSEKFLQVIEPMPMGAGF